MPGGGPLLRKNGKSPGGLPQFAEPSQPPSCILLIDQATRVVANHYDLGNVQKVAQLYGGYTNLSFTVTTQRCSSFKKYFLRIYRQDTSVEHICFEHALIDHIVASGSHMVARLIRTRDGANFVRRIAPTPHGTKELYYAMFEFIGGEDKYSWTSNHLSDEEYAYSGRSLAELHCASAGFDPGALPSPHLPILERLASLPEDLRRCADLAADSCFDKYFLHNLPEMLRISQQTSKQLTETAELPVIGIHGDSTPATRNTISTGSSECSTLIVPASICAYLMWPWRSSTSAVAGKATWMATSGSIKLHCFCRPIRSGPVAPTNQARCCRRKSG